MGSRMELVAGHARDVLVVVGTGEEGAFRDRGRFRAYLSLSGGLDPTWLDFFAEAARAATDLDGPADFIDARTELGGSDDPSGTLTIERVDPGWVSAVARISDEARGAIAGRWIDRLEEELGPLPGEEKPWIRELVGQVIAFCRAADRAPDVLFVWSL
jgi:hypothetical protein